MTILGLLLISPKGRKLINRAKYINTYNNIIENALHKWIAPNKKNHDYFLEEKNIKFEHKSVTKWQFLDLNILIF